MSDEAVKKPGRPKQPKFEVETVAPKTLGTQRSVSLARNNKGAWCVYTLAFNQDLGEASVIGTEEHGSLLVAQEQLKIKVANLFLTLG